MRERRRVHDTLTVGPTAQGDGSNLARRGVACGCRTVCQSTGRARWHVYRRHASARRVRPLWACLVLAVHACVLSQALWEQAGADELRRMQTEAIAQGRADWGYWGTDPDVYSGWKSHSNRLVPVYTFGMGLEGIAGSASPYRSEQAVRRLYGRLPHNTVQPQAPYFDQTGVYQLQQAAVRSGKKYIVLMVFDGMDWQTTWAAALYASGQVGYRTGRGSGLAFQNYASVSTDYGWCVCSPHNSGTTVDVDTQSVLKPGGTLGGGYDPFRGGHAPWEPAADPAYLIGEGRGAPHAYPDSAATATALAAGVKTFNDAINVDVTGQQVPTIAHQLQARGFAIGVVTSVTISHATPACAYANNVSRDDYQDLTRDLLGLPSVSHPRQPLPGVDVLLGAGWGEVVREDAGQGSNFVPGNRYLTEADRRAIDAASGGRYVYIERTPGRSGRALLQEAAAQAAGANLRLCGLFGTTYSHLPFATADGGFDPTLGAGGTAETYTPADLQENPTLAELTRAALAVLERRGEGFWLLIEAGDVDWANHDNNLDNSVGAVLSGDAAFREVAAWAESRGCWEQTVVIVTADHGHLLEITRPEAIAAAGARARGGAAGRERPLPVGRAARLSTSRGDRP
jgi:alkaline phosphatase